MKYRLLLLTLLALGACNLKPHKIEPVEMTSPSDPYRSSMVKAEDFLVSGSSDTVIESKKGSVIAIPSGSFIDEDGNEVQGQVHVKFADALSLDDMLKSHLTT